MYVIIVDILNSDFYRPTRTGKAYMLAQVADRLLGAWWGAFLGDAAAMPTHGFSSVKLLTQDYGNVSDFLAPKPTHPESVLHTLPMPQLPQEYDFIGDKRRNIWKIRDAHPHCTLSAGENTLPMYLALHLTASMAEKGCFDLNDWCERYRIVMTTPDVVNDTFISSIHRKYFENLAAGKSPEQNGCPEAHISDIPIFLPLMLYALRNFEKTQMDIMRAIRKFATGESAFSSASFVAEILYNIIKGATLEETLYQKMTPDRHVSLAFPLRRWIKNHDDEQAINSTGIFATTEEAMPLSLYIALKYNNNFRKAIFKNANIGGETTGRGAVIGMILGAQIGFANLPQDLIAKLKYAGEIQALGDMLKNLI